MENNSVYEDVAVTVDNITVLMDAAIERNAKLGIQGHFFHLGADACECFIKAARLRGVYARPMEMGKPTYWYYGVGVVPDAEQQSDTFCLKPRKRVEGYYWVKFHTTAMVGLWMHNGIECVWRLPGINNSYNDSELSYISEYCIVPPEDARLL